MHKTPVLCVIIIIIIIYLLFSYLWCVGRPCCPVWRRGGPDWRRRGWWGGRGASTPMTMIIIITIEIKLRQKSLKFGNTDFFCFQGTIKLIRHVLTNELLSPRKAKKGHQNSTLGHSDGILYTIHQESPCMRTLTLLEGADIHLPLSPSPRNSISSRPSENREDDYYYPYQNYGTG